MTQEQNEYTTNIFRLVEDYHGSPVSDYFENFVRSRIKLHDDVSDNKLDEVLLAGELDAAAEFKLNAPLY